jgi:hypothetical protein
VQDTGIGISPEDQKKIFQQFFRSEDSKVREVTGTGLGLSITKNLVEMQGRSGLSASPITERLFHNSGRRDRLTLLELDRVALRLAFLFSGRHHMVGI